MNIMKRDGTEVPFDLEKIRAAITKASRDVLPAKQLSESDVANITNAVAVRCLASLHVMHVEEIQDAVEDELMKIGAFAVAKAYITYRYKRTIVRNGSDEFFASLRPKIEATDIQNQNANVDECSFGGRTGEATNEMMKQYALKYCLSDMARENHLNNEIYTHDLSSYAVGCHNCLSIPFDDLLAKGFAVRQTDIRPAGSINTAFQLIAVIMQIQSLQQFGGVSATHLDWTMVPYVRKSFAKHYADGLDYIVKSPAAAVMYRAQGKTKDCPIDDTDHYDHEEVRQYALDMTERELKQAVEGMYHNLNTLQSRSGNQLPFSSINFGTCTLPEGRMVIRALLEGSIAGVGKLHRTPVFPCSIFQCMTGVNRKPGDSNYDLFLLALESTSKRLYPNYCNVDWSGNAGYDPNDPRTYTSTMGCRTFNGFDINGFGQLKDGRGNICPVTIIMPTIAMQAKEQFELHPANGESLDEIFLTILNKKIYEAKDQLIERYEYICSQSPASAKFMYENNTMAGYIPAEGIRSAIKHGTLAIGQLGLAETLQILVGCDHTTPVGMALAHRIEKLFRTRCDEFKQTYHLNFGVYFSPECEA